jgi:hypothetical protein
MRVDVDVDPREAKEKALWMVGLDALSPTTRRRLLAAIGTGALVVAVLLVAAPWLPVWLAGPLLPLVAETGTSAVVFLGLVGAAVGLLSLSGKTAPGKPTGLEIDVPDLPRDRQIRRTVEPPGNRLDSLLDRVSGEAENPSRGVNRVVDKRQIRKQLRNAAADVLVDTRNLHREEALTRIEDGTWTDSRRAASFLGGADAPRPRLSTRIRDWASGDPFVRQVQATVDEIAGLADVRTDGRLLDAAPDPIERPLAGYDLSEEAPDETGVELALDVPGTGGPEIDASESDENDADPPGTADGGTGGDDAPESRAGTAVADDEGDGEDSSDPEPDADSASDDGDRPDDGLPEEWVSPGNQGGTDPGGDGDDRETTTERERSDGGESP